MKVINLLTFSTCKRLITIIRYAKSQKIGKSNNLKVFGSYKAMGINRIAKIGSKVTYA
jgi:hypothetical protein